MTVVLGPAMGGVIIGHEIARYLGVPMIYAEREGGEMKLRRGFTLAPNDNVLIAENTVSTGGSQKETIDLARTYGRRRRGRRCDRRPVAGCVVRRSVRGAAEDRRDVLGRRRVPAVRAGFGTRRAG